MGIRDTQTMIGVDGGGTGCRVAICDTRGEPLVEARGGAANFTTNPTQTIENVLSALRQAAKEAQLNEDQLRGSCAHVGLAGVMNDADSEKIAAALPIARVHVSDDRMTSLAGALDDRDGAVAAIGTGSFVAARQGAACRFFGGWGLQVGDQCSGAWLGRAALERSLLALDGLEAESGLTAQIMARFENDPVQLLTFAHRAQPHDYAELAPLVVEAASAGDSNGRALMLRGAAYIDACLTASTASEHGVICLIGGLGSHYAPYLDPRFQARIAPPAGTALDGALYLARQHLNGMETPT